MGYAHTNTRPFKWIYECLGRGCAFLRSVRPIQKEKPRFNAPHAIDRFNERNGCSSLGIVFALNTHSKHVRTTMGACMMCPASATILVHVPFDALSMLSSWTAAAAAGVCVLFSVCVSFSRSVVRGINCFFINLIASFISPLFVSSLSLAPAKLHNYRRAHQPHYTGKWL